MQSNCSHSTLWIQYIKNLDFTKNGLNIVLPRHLDTVFRRLRSRLLHGDHGGTLRHGAHPSDEPAPGRQDIQRLCWLRRQGNDAVLFCNFYCWTVAKLFCFLDCQERRTTGSVCRLHSHLGSFRPYHLPATGHFWTDQTNLRSGRQWRVSRHRHSFWLKMNEVVEVQR